MSNVPFQTDQADADAPASEPLRKPKKTAKTVKKAKATKRATKKSAAQSTKNSSDKPAAERSNKKAEVIAMMKRAKGVTLAAIVAATGWQKHTVRGFVSILGNKGGEKIESSKNTAGERTYRIVK
jgi:hypothetical protein